MSSRLSLIILRVVLGLVIGGYSAALVLRHFLNGHARWHSHAFLMGFAELLAAILFLIPKTMRCAGVALILIIGYAMFFQLLHGEYNVGYLAIYIAGVLAVICNPT
jgi:hypothetical protein